MASEYRELRRDDEGQGSAARTRLHGEGLAQAVAGEPPSRRRAYASRALFALAILVWGVLVWWVNQ